MQKIIINGDTDTIPFTEMYLKWTTDLNAKCKTMKFLDYNIGENLEPQETLNG